MFHAPSSLGRYALGRMLLFMLTGVPPHKTADQLRREISGGGCCGCGGDSAVTVVDVDEVRRMPTTPAPIPLQCPSTRRRRR